MRSRLFVLALLVFALLASACGSIPNASPTLVNPPSDPGSGGTSSNATAVTATDIVAAETQVPANTQSATKTPTETPESDETLMLNRQGELAPNLVDDRSRSLYVYMNDEPYSGLSACVDDCAVEWPPLTVSATPVAGDNVDPALIGTIIRPDGSIQATYNGWPLYYYISDTIPGSTFGQGYNRNWFLVSPEGEPIRR